MAGEAAGEAVVCLEGMSGWGSQCEMETLPSMAEIWAGILKLLIWKSL